MSSLRIENSLNGFFTYNPAPLFPQPNTFTLDQMLIDVNNYWGNPNAEKMFTVPFWKAEELITNSNLDQIALKVINLEDPAIVSAQWVSFNIETTHPNNHASPQIIAKEATEKIMLIVSSFLTADTDTESYFAFGNDLMNDFRQAITQAGRTPVSETVNARIGRNANGDTLVYFFLGNIVLHTAPPAAGSTASCGVRVPPGQ